MTVPQPKWVADVQTAVRFATERNLPVTILVTGHQMVRSAEGAVLINMSPDEHIDRGRSLARVVSGAPRPMKMGTTASPRRYDAIIDYTLQPTNLRWPAILRYASWAAVFRVAGRSDYPSIAALSINPGIDEMGHKRTFAK